MIAGRGQLALDPLGRLDAAGRGQREVHQDDVGRRLEGPIDGAPGIVGLADDLEVRLRPEDVGDAHPEQGVVVDDQDPRPFPEVPAVRTAPTSLGAAVVHRAHLLSSTPVARSLGS